MHMMACWKEVYPKCTELGTERDCTWGMGHYHPFIYKYCSQRLGRLQIQYETKLIRVTVGIKMRFSSPLLAFLFGFGLISTCYAAPLNSTDENAGTSGIQITFRSSLVGSFVDRQWCPGPVGEPRTPCNKDYAYNNMYFVAANRFVPGSTGINSGATVTCPSNLSGEDCIFLVTGQYTINGQLKRMYFDESGVKAGGPITPYGRVRSK